MKGMENVMATVTKVEITGACADRFEPVRAAFLDNLDTGQDVQGARVPADARVAWWAGNGGGFTPNRWISGPHEQTRSGWIIAAAYEGLAR